MNLLTKTLSMVGMISTMTALGSVAQAADPMTVTMNQKSSSINSTNMSQRG